MPMDPRKMMGMVVALKSNGELLLWAAPRLREEEVQWVLEWWCHCSWKKRNKVSF